MFEMQSQRKMEDGLYLCQCLLGIEKLIIYFLISFMCACFQHKKPKYINKVNFSFQVNAT